LLDNYDKVSQSGCRKSDINSAVSILGESLNQSSPTKAGDGKSLPDTVESLFHGKGRLDQGFLNESDTWINRQRISICKTR
jgi:hypothetical protein